jgi:hypothetical protein
MLGTADVAAAAELTRFYDICSEIPSGQSGFEAEMEARARLQRHAPLAIRDEWNGRILWLDHGIRCGLVEVGLGDEGFGRVPELPDEDHAVMVRERFAARVARTLARADDLARALTEPAWTCPAPPSHVLRLRIREFLPPSRWAFDPLYRPLREQEKRQPTMISVPQTKIRGPGNLAHLVPAALLAWKRSRSILTVERWADRLGRVLAQPVAPVETRELGRQVKLECEMLEALAFAFFRRGRTHVPHRVQRAGVLALGG